MRLCAWCVLLQQYSVGLERRADRAAVVPPRHLGGPDAGAALDHPLEGVGEVPLPLVGRLLQHVVDAAPQLVHRPHVVQADVGELGDGLPRLLDDLRHVARAVGDHHAEALVVLDLLGPDDPVVGARRDDREVGVEHRVHEDDHHGPVHVRPGQVDRARRAVLHLLLDEPRRDGVPLAGVGFDLLLEVPGDEDQLLDAEPLQAVHHPVHHRPARDLDERLRHRVGVRPEPGALPCQRNDDLHAKPSRSGP